MTTMTSPATSSPVGADGTEPGGLSGALAAEWAKLWSVRSTWWCLIAAVVLMGGSAAVLGMDFVHDVNDPQTVQDGTGTTMKIVDISAPSVQLAQFAIIALGVLAITTEYSSGGIRATLRAQPRRGRVLLAKALVVGAVTFVAGLPIGALGDVTAWATLGEHGIGTTSDIVVNVLSIGAYLALVAMLSVGIGALLRSTGGALTAVFALLVGFSLFSVGSVSHYLPGMAGLDFLQGESMKGLVVACWTVAALIAGFLVLRRRDA